MRPRRRSGKTATVTLAESLADLAPVLHRDRGLFRHLGLGFREVAVCRRLPRDLGPRDLLLWAGEHRALPTLPADATGLLRSRKVGAFGLVYGRTAEDVRLLLSRWDEVEAAGGEVRFGGSVSEEEVGADELRWVLDRLAACHSHSYGRGVDWERIERQARRMIDSAPDAREHLRAWEWLFAQLRDNHTKVVGVGGAHACSRVHCGLYGRFIDPHRFLVERVHPRSAAAEAGLAVGTCILGVDGLDWPAYLRQEVAYWAFSTPHCRRACRRFLAWHQPAGTRLKLDTSGGKRLLRFGEASYPGFLHWTYDGRPEPLAWVWVAPGRCRLRIAFFPADEEFVSCCRAALPAVPPGARLELDLRGNTGGNGVAGRAVASMFLPRGTPLSRHRGRRVGGPFSPWVVCRSEDPPVYLGPLDVLMDELSGSATEGVLGALKAAGRARLIGRRSAGSSGNPRVFVSRGGLRFTCSSWEETTPAGEPIEGHGIAPHLSLEQWRER